MDEKIWDEDEDDHAEAEEEIDGGRVGDYEEYSCAFCGEMNEIFVDRTVARRQQFTEDCEVCCRPNLIKVVIDPEAGVYIEAEQEYDA